MILEGQPLVLGFVGSGPVSRQNILEMEATQFMLDRRQLERGTGYGKARHSSQGRILSDTPPAVPYLHPKVA